MTWPKNAVSQRCTTVKLHLKVIFLVYYVFPLVIISYKVFWLWQKYKQIMTEWGIYALAWWERLPIIINYFFFINSNRLFMVWIAIMWRTNDKQILHGLGNLAQVFKKCLKSKDLQTLQKAQDRHILIFSFYFNNKNTKKVIFAPGAGAFFELMVCNR